MVASFGDGREDALREVLRTVDAAKAANIEDGCRKTVESLRTLALALDAAILDEPPGDDALALELVVVLQSLEALMQGMLYRIAVGEPPQLSSGAATAKPKAGDRIRLVSMRDDPRPIQPGETGTIVGIKRHTRSGRFWAQIDVSWDNGRRLMLVSPPDRFEVIGASGK
jgi:hypothetical protein